MKSIYVKPVIEFEDFSLSKSIAGSCEVKTNTPALYACGIEMPPDEVIFLETMTSVCNSYPTDGKYDSGCYDVPTDDRDLFNS